MRRGLVLVLALALAACGSTTSTQTHASRTPFYTLTAPPEHTQTQPQHKLTPAQVAQAYQRFRTTIATFGQPGSSQQQSEISAVLTHYFAVVARGEYKQACELLPSFQQLEIGGVTCANRFEQLFKLPAYSGLKQTLGHLAVSGVRVTGQANGSRGYAVLNEGGSSQSVRYMPIARQAGEWKPASHLPPPLRPLPEH